MAEIALAEIETVVRVALMRHGAREWIAREDLDEALLRQSVGSQQARRLTETERRIVAYHERQDARFAQAAADISDATGKPILLATELAVADPGNEQSAQWRQVRQANPDWVFLRTWGVSTPVAVKTAARFGFPVDHIIGDIWASSSEDVLPAGAAAWEMGRSTWVGSLLVAQPVRSSATRASMLTILHWRRA